MLLEVLEAVEVSEVMRCVLFGMLAALLSVGSFSELHSEKVRKIFHERVSSSDISPRMPTPRTYRGHPR